MFSAFIVFSCLVQMTAYALAERSEPWQKQWRTLIFVIFMLSNFILFPIVYPIPEYPDGPKCGMPILGITLGFWTIGNIFTILTHLFFKAVNAAMKNSATKNGHQRTSPKSTQN
ncbi:MAG: hypothetical protein IT258_01780 [Saprospiraceae bacterium]|nr:hypothetical protein [Saprospiraceae bacterium]